MHQQFNRSIPFAAIRRRCIWNERSGRIGPSVSTESDYSETTLPRTPVSRASNSSRHVTALNERSSGARLPLFAAHLGASEGRLASIADRNTEIVLP